MNRKFHLVLGFSLCLPLLLAVGSLHSQDKSSSGSPAEMTYENHNQVDPNPLSVRSLAGTVQDEHGGTIPDGTLALFTEKEHKLVRSVQTSRAGFFKFSDVPSGKYRLVVKYDGFCAANIPVAIGRHGSGNQPIYVYMKVAGIDSCSYGQLGPKQ